MLNERFKTVERRLIAYQHRLINQLSAAPIEELGGELSDVLADRLRISMPEVWIYQAPDPNAFATGPTKNNAMVAVSTGLLENMNETEVRSVLAHEMGHQVYVIDGYRLSNYRKGVGGRAKTDAPSGWLAQRRR